MTGLDACSERARDHPRFQLDAARLIISTWSSYVVHKCYKCNLVCVHVLPEEEHPTLRSWPYFDFRLKAIRSSSLAVPRPCVRLPDCGDVDPAFGPRYCGTHLVDARQVTGLVWWRRGRK